MTYLKSILTAAAVAFAVPAAAADGITITDAYAIAASPMAKAGAAFFVIENLTDTDDRLIDARSDVAMKVELHTHIAGDGGMMQMVHVPEGFAVPAGGSHALQRGGDHVMFMGLTRGLAEGDTVAVTLVFEKAGEIEIEVPVDLSRPEPMEMAPAPSN